MAGPEPSVRSGVADLVAAIERAAGDLGLAEEPARFLATLEAGAPGAEPPPRDPPAATRTGAS
jgi:hypothetical protein